MGDMAHVHITNDRDHTVFVFIRDQLADAAAFARENIDEQGLLRFGDKYFTHGPKLTVSLRQHWPPQPSSEGTLVGSIDMFVTDLVLEEPPESTRIAVLTTHAVLTDTARPTTHEDLFAIYKTRADEHGCGFLLAGELDEAAQVLVNSQPALDPVAGTFKLTFGWAYVELARLSCELPQFGCSVTYYSVAVPPTGAIEAAFIELLDGAVPSGQ
jgi:hypothetical protein